MFVRGVNARLSELDVELLHDRPAGIIDSGDPRGEGVDGVALLALGPDDGLDVDRGVRRGHRGELLAAAAAGAAAGDKHRRAGGDDDRRAPDHSTVTVLARFRGWSTFSPFRRATWYARSCSGS